MQRLALLTTILAPLVLATACAADPARDLNLLPAKMQNAPTRVRAAYQFAVANPDALKNVPCYCGCGAIGHTSNYSCYVKASQADGTPVFDEHALGCSICVDISQDVMRLSREGKSPGEIRAFIVSTYSQFGPPNQSER
jgi:hypothetical protein